MSSKKERKVLAQEAIRQRELLALEKSEKESKECQYFHVLSDFDFSLKQWMKLLKKELKNFNVNIVLSLKDAQTIEIQVPNFDIESSCYLTIGNDLKVTVPNLDTYDGDSSDSMLEGLTKKSFVTLSGRRKKNDVINLVFNTSTRVLGRVTKGVLVDVEQEYIGNDWVAWSCDYYEKDLFKAFNYENLPQEFPYLVAKKRWGIF